MFIYENNEANLSLDTEAYCEAVASQEEIYLEETEQEICVILEAYSPPSQPRDEPNRQREHAAEELITGDSDDPPLSEEAVEEILGMD